MDDLPYCVDHRGGCERVCRWVDSEKAQKAFRKMINEGSEPISIVRNLTYHFNKLLTVLGHMETGEPVDKAVYKLVPRIIFYREPAFKRQLGFWRKDKLLGVTELLYKCERDCKSTNMPAEEIVSYTIMQISSPAIECIGFLEELMLAGGRIERIVHIICAARLQRRPY